MIELKDVEKLYQWEIGVHVSARTGNAVQFANQGDSQAVTILLNDKKLARIPDRYLTSGKPLVVYAVTVNEGGDTTATHSVRVFPVNAKPKPKDYTPTAAEEAFGVVKTLTDEAKAAATSALGHAQDASASVQEAYSYASNAQASADLAEQSAKEAEEIVQEVESVKSAFDISSEEIPGSENILDPSLQEVGAFATPTVGEELVRTDQPSSSRFRTKATQIEVEPNETLYLYLNAESASSNVVFYYCDADKKYIKLDTINLSTIIEKQEAGTPSAITIPSGAKYIDITINRNSGAIDFSKFCISRTQIGFTEWVEPEEVFHVMVKEECIPDLPYVKNDILHERPARNLNILDPGNQYAERGEFKVVDGKLTPVTSTGRYRSNEPISIKPGTLYLYASVIGVDAASESNVILYYLDESENWLGTETLKYKNIIAKGFVQTSRISSKCTHIHVVVGGASSGYSFKNVCISYEPTYEFSEYNADVEETIDALKLPDQVSHPLFGKTIVNLGDSITGMRRAPVDISTELATRTGAKVYNCGFGGCRMAAHNIAAYDAFSMYRLADEIVKDSTDSTKWADQENYVENNTDDSADPGGLKEEATSLAAHFRLSLDNLKDLDFSKVDVITIAYGTNDFTANVPIENPDDLDDTATFAGAFRYSVEKLLAKYPHLKVFVCGQTFRFWINSTTGVITTSDVRLNDNGAKLEQFVEKTKLLAEEYHLPFVDLYNVGMNIHNRARYFTETDGTHPLPEGLRMIAGKMAKEMF